MRPIIESDNNVGDCSDDAASSCLQLKGGFELVGGASAI